MHLLGLTFTMNTIFGAGYDDNGLKNMEIIKNKTDSPVAQKSSLNMKQGR